MRRLVKIHDLGELAKFDEFHQAILADGVCKELKGFEEGPLTFDPTYKYNKDS